jgi:hypothetical protein
MRSARQAKLLLVSIFDSLSPSPIRHLVAQLQTPKACELRGHRGRLRRRDDGAEHQPRSRRAASILG